MHLVQPVWSLHWRCLWPGHGAEWRAAAAAAAGDTSAGASSAAADAVDEPLLAWMGVLVARGARHPNASVRKMTLASWLSLFGPASSGRGGGGGQSALPAGGPLRAALAASLALLPAFDLERLTEIRGESGVGGGATGTEEGGEAQDEEEEGGGGGGGAGAADGAAPDGVTSTLQLRAALIRFLAATLARLADPAASGASSSGTAAAGAVAGGEDDPLAPGAFLRGYLRRALAATKPPAAAFLLEALLQALPAGSGRGGGGDGAARAVGSGGDAALLELLASGAERLALAAAPEPRRRVLAAVAALATALVHPGRCSLGQLLALPSPPAGWLAAALEGREEARAAEAVSWLLLQPSAGSGSGGGTAHTPARLAALAGALGACAPAAAATHGALSAHAEALAAGAPGAAAAAGDGSAAPLFAYTAAALAACPAPPPGLPRLASALLKLLAASPRALSAAGAPLLRRLGAAHRPAAEAGGPLAAPAAEVAAR